MPSPRRLLVVLACLVALGSSAACAQLGFGGSPASTPTPTPTPTRTKTPEPEPEAKREPERYKYTTDLVTVTLVSMDLIPTQGGLTAAPITEADTRAGDDAGSWFLRSHAVPSETGYERVVETVEVLFCPSTRTRWDDCRSSVVWRRGMHPYDGAWVGDEAVATKGKGKR